ncbi:hypothetical protein AKJ47_02535 [candidate division MSBL1 archaeon SCGC-AAA261G05]|uniref:YjbQ family protein n=1 Tax=candidate division MSBL1 archaeon SCGC-AAA261G05 TaxID=1698276 RepID=A0A133VA19_9EURY|nr:hypothetical protein AKJ47_02535 [candidate division MSBL1 archaeon SCGC-AAA261G05]
MRSEFKEIKISTSSKFQLVNISSEVENAVRESGIKNGLCHVYAVHSTPAIIATEDEGRLKEDFLKMVKDMFPPDADWRHPMNAYAHMASAFLATSRTFPVRDGKLVRGTWQEVFLLEFDGPKSE